MSKEEHKIKVIIGDDSVDSTHSTDKDFFTQVVNDNYEKQGIDNSKIKYKRGNCYTLKRYRPAFFEGFPEEWAKIDGYFGITELLNVGFIFQWKENKSFYRFSEEFREYKDGHQLTLMAEYDEGYKWYVIGFITSSDPQEIFSLGLPTFKSKYKEEEKE